MKNQKKINTIFAHYGVEHAALFGSQATGNVHEKSDYDFFITFSPEKKYTLLHIASLKRNLEEALEAPVDIVTDKSLHPYLKDSVLSNLQSVYDSRS